MINIYIHNTSEDQDKLFARALMSMHKGEFNSKNYEFEELNSLEKTIREQQLQDEEKQKRNDSLFSRVVDESKDVFIKAPLHGINKAGEELIQFTYDTMDWFDDFLGIDAIEGDWSSKNVLGSEAYKPETKVGNIVAPIAQFLTGFGLSSIALGPIGPGVKASKAVKYGFSALKGAVTDAAFFDPTEERLSNLIERVPALSNPITNYLKADPEKDSRAEGRLKNALEGVLAGFAVDSVLQGIKGIKKYLTHGKGKLQGAELENFINQIKKEVDDVIKSDSTLQKEIPIIQKGAGEAATEVEDLIPTIKGGKQVIGDLNPVDLIKKYYEFKSQGKPISDFFPTESIRNSSESIEEIQRLFQILDNPEVLTRDTAQTVTQHISGILEDAKTIISEIAKTNKLDISIPAFMSKLGDQTHNLALKVCIVEAYMENISKRCAVYLNDLVKNIPQDQIGESLSKDGANLLRLMGVVSAHYDRIQTGIGRGLQAFKAKGAIDIESILNTSLTKKMGSTVDDLLKAQEHAISLMTSDEILASLNRAAIVPDKIKLAKGLSSMSKANKLLILSNEYWLNAILSGHVTHLVNFTSGLLKVAVAQPASKILGGGIGFLRESLKHNTTEAATNLAVFREGVRAWAGLAYSLSDAWRLAKESFSLGSNILKPNNAVIEGQLRAIAAESFNLSAEEGFGKAIEHFGRVINLPTRFLMAEDEFVSQLAYRQHLFTKLYAKAEELINRGVLKGKDKKTLITEYIEQNFDKHFASIIDSSTGRTINNAIGSLKSGLDEAMDATFTQELSSGFQKNLQNMINESPIMRRFVAPFIRTPINIFKDAVAHTPLLANTLDSYKAAIKAGGRDAAIAKGKVYLGSMIWTTVLTFAANGQITGSGPRDPRHRASLLETGWKPFSIKVGNKYVSYGRIEPFATILGIGSDLADIYSQIDESDESMWEKANDLATQAIFSVFNTVGSKTFMTGFADLVDAWASEEGLMKYLDNARNSYIPALSQQVRKAVDPELREARGWIEDFKNRVPFLSQELPTKYSWLTGQPLQPYGGRMAGISPIVLEEKNNNPVAEELVKLKVGFFAPPRKIGGVNLTSEQYSELSRLNGTIKIHGKTLMESLEKLLSSRKYDLKRERFADSDDPKMGERFLMISKVINEYRKASRKELFKQYPELSDELLTSEKQGRRTIYREVVKATGRKKPREGTEQDHKLKERLNKIIRY